MFNLLEHGADASPREPNPMNATATRRSLTPALLLGVIVACLAARAAIGPLPLAMRSNLALFVGAGAAWWLACGDKHRGALTIGWLWIGWFATRLIALGSDPQTSDDIWRYVWEGGLVGERVSPYAYAPAHEALATWRDAWPEVYQRVNHPTLSAIYPPGIEGVFAAVVALAGGPAAGAGEHAKLALRGLFLIADGAVLAALLRLLARRGIAPGAAVVWAWSPLVALEFAGAGHLDALAIALLVAALATSAGSEGRWGSARWAWALLLVCAGALVKLVPFFALPWVARGADPLLDSTRPRPSWRRWRVGLGIAAVLVLFIASYLPLASFRGGFAGIGSGIGEYGFRWEAASLVYRFVQPAFGLFCPYDEGPFDPRRVAKLALGIVFAWFAWSEWRRGARPERAAFVLIGAWLVLAPTLHPWYLAWVVPFLAVHPSQAWRTLIALAPLAYWPLERWRAAQVWHEPLWVWFALAIPFFVLLVREQWLARRAV